MTGTGAQPLPSILVVCTANRCRSPLVAGLLIRALGDRGMAASIRSTGLKDSGHPPTDETLEVASRRSLVLADHQSSTLDPGEAADADLVIGLERHHVREVVILVPSAWPRTFTLRELVRRGETIGARRRCESLPDWIARVHADRERRDMLGASTLDDIADPTGGTLTEHEDAANELTLLVDRLVDLAWRPRS